VLAKSILLFVLAAILEIGGAWLVWQGVREHRGWLWMGAGVIALAAYGGVFIAGSLVWGMVADGFRPDRWDILGAVVSLAGVGLIMYGPRLAVSSNVTERSARM
jgi:small multidrug resistance family-3 protein